MTGPLSLSVRSWIVLGVAIFAAASIVLGVQWSYGALAAWPWIAQADPALQETVFTLILFGLLLSVAAVGLSREGMPLRELGGPQPGPMAGIGLLSGAAGLLCAVALSAVAGVVASGIGGGFGAAVLVSLIVVLFQAGVEETYFRGWVQPVLSRGWGEWSGLLATSVAFAVLHIAGGAVSLSAIANLLLGGLWFGLLAQRSGGITLPTFAHFAWNWLELVGLGLMPNPGQGNFGAVVDLDLTGAAAWGGSEEGLNASLSTSFALAALIAVTLFWRTGAPVSSPARPG